MALSKESVDLHLGDCETPAPLDNNVRLRVLRRQHMENRMFSYMEQMSELDTMPLTQLEVRMSLLDRQFEAFENIQSELELLDESQFTENHRENFETAYIEVKSRIAERISILRMETNETLLSSTRIVSPPTANTRTSLLPKLQLLKFSGQHKEWLDFFNMFTILVHDDKDLSAVAKFQYLRSCLTDNAARVIQSIETTPENYAKAIELLKARYDNKRSIFQSHIADIFGIQKVTNPTMSAILEFIDIINSNLRAMQSVATNQQIADGIILHMVVSKLDNETQIKWEEEVSLNLEECSYSAELQLPTWDKLALFLERRCKTLEIIERNDHRHAKVSVRQNTSWSQNVSKPHSSQVSFLVAKNPDSKCQVCNSTPAHSIFKCSTFVNLSVSDRFNLAKTKKLCLNCLSATHFANRCPSLNRCQYCRNSHHTLLHRENPASTTQSSELAETETTVDESTSHAQTSVTFKVSQPTSEVLLGTARVDLSNSKGVSIIGRALLDSASQLNFITERMAQHLRLNRKRVNLEINGVGEASTVAHQVSSIVVKSLINGFSEQINVVVIPSITSYQPRYKLNSEDWNIPKNITLADNAFNSPGPIDLLIGAELFYNLLLVGQIKLDNAPVLQKTKLGWIVAGSTNSLAINSAAAMPNKIASNVVTLQSSLPNRCLLISSSQQPLESILQRFWSLEHYSQKSSSFSEEEEFCERHFQETTKRCPESKKFIVRLPFKESPLALGESFNIARKRFSFLENKFARNRSLEREYTRFIDEYIDMKHMKLVPLRDIHQRYFIPHHCVIKSDSSTTRLRVVFDASCSTTNGKSLNDMLCVGPTIQNDIFHILTRFRFHKFVLVADIAKMYRQILIDECDAPWQSIIWRNKNDESVSIYQLQTVTYGTSSAPYLATKCLNQLAKEEVTTYPLGSKVIENDFYVDNLMTGSECITSLMEIKSQVIELLKAGGFPLRKFASNCAKVIDDIADEDREDIIHVPNMQYIKTLGLRWSPTEDVFSFDYRKQLSSTKTSKRKILSHIASIFDPLGLINPIVVKCKILMQNLWSLQLDWDESIPQDVFYQWEHIRHQLELIGTIKINRFVIYNNDTQIHAFSDASTKAYGACIYAVTVCEEGSSSMLLCSKSRVSPLKQITLPRLELCAAVLLSELLNSLINTLPTKPDSITCWSDSTVTLSWIAGQPSRWTTFVANRVTKIQNLTSNMVWRHVPTSLNPADLLSRGATADTIINNNLWLFGPEFMKMPKTQWPPENNVHGDTMLEVRSSKIVLAATLSTDVICEHKYVNNYCKLVRIFAYINRFIAACRKVPVERGIVTAIEMNEAITTICRVIQYSRFMDELTSLSKNKPLKRQSTLCRLAPFLHDNLIRVGGRLKNSSLDFNTKHPILLPSSHPFVKTLIRHFHYKNLHAGVLTLHNTIRDKFWITNGRNVIKGIIHNCTICFRCRPVTEFQIMGELPKDRVNPSFPFEVCGVDYCGPLLMTQRIRGRAAIKVYIAVFICFTTKAVHLELVPDLSTSAFIAALKRFISRRGRCRVIYSDNATNFLGANRELKGLLHSFLSDTHETTVTEACRDEGIEWKFIPPRSPHFGGLWESAVKQAKHYLRRTVGTHILSQDELHTVCCQAEAIINSRPLTPMSSDPNDMRALTPSHFLIGRTATTVIEPSLIETNQSLLQRYQLVKWIHQQFWERWSQEYLKTLQQRPKWTTNQANVQKDDLVVIKCENTPPLKWPLGRVTQAITGSDGKVRVVVVKTSNGTYKRTIAKICKIPLES